MMDSLLTGLCSLFSLHADLLSRLGLALLAGLLIGLERERHGHAAGLRTMILVCLASALAMVFSEYIYQAGGLPLTTPHPDPARLPAGVLSGMGFLGAGAIMREGNLIRGVTTAATLWFVTILGLIFGGGHFQLGLIGLGVALTVLYILPYFENHIKNDWYGAILITTDKDGPDEKLLRQAIEKLGIRIQGMQCNYDAIKHHRTIKYKVQYKKQDAFDHAHHTIKKILAFSGIIKIKWL